ncbi:hypothetical protein PpBr36_08946 [Pyricularia pennisetigena]|uniref:hypothetical protein n=1 Tax=Pyricularia pennisetigena TaxID=1578925 RepID=UPI0011529EB0|nr:hypothetical protein PpBr36_08946 [Pyricularia pennisetigena]TLS24365.1 hypothetical protein PpBr36_08946 [Pyricularia pennisetigena]
MVMPGDHSMQRASLQVAPLAIRNKGSRHGHGSDTENDASFTSVSSNNSDATITDSRSVAANSNKTTTTTTTAKQPNAAIDSSNGSHMKSSSRNGPREEPLEADPDMAPAVFHNFLRAFFHFKPSLLMTDSTVTLPLAEGDVILVHSIHTNGWADGTLLATGARGWLPTNYCEPYGPDELMNLLNALLNFWDLLRSTSVNDHEIFSNQEFMKGIIAGVRYLLERTNSLTREAPLIQRHEGLRRSRKSLLSELSSLVKTAKRLQEHQRMITPIEDTNDIIDEMILKAFKIVTKGTRFLDILDEDRKSRAPAVTVMATVMEEVTPTVDGKPANSEQAKALRALTAGASEDSSAVGDDTTEHTVVVRPTNRRMSTITSPISATNTRRMSLGSNPHRVSTAISHRVSLVPSPSTKAQNLISQQLSDSHDTFLSYLGSFIGRLHLQSQSRPHLSLAVKQSATSGGELLVVVDVVCAHNRMSQDFLDTYRDAMYARLRDLVLAAQEVLTSHGGREMEDVIFPQDNSRLLQAATGCVRATGECVAKTKWFLEKIGDFEFELERGASALNMDLGFLEINVAEDRDKDQGMDATSIAESNKSCSTEASTATATATQSVASTTATVRPTALATNKPLPEVPQSTTPDEAPRPQRSPSSSRPTSLVEEGPASMASSVASLRPMLPPLPRLSTSLMTQDEYSPSEHSAGHDSDNYHGSFRSESMTASSSGTGSTYISRDSESSLVSQSSTRATTPDIPLANQKSLSDISNSGSGACVVEEDDVESRLLERTYAHELMFNKEGQVTGGSLPALVERLTTHESTPDAMFVSTFYLTFRLFCTPVKLAESLIDRFDYVAESAHMAGPVRLRVYNVFKGWLESHWRDETDREALGLIEPFATFKLGEVLPSAGKRILELVDRVSASGGGALVPRLVSSMGKTNTSISQYVPADTPMPNPVFTKSHANLLANWRNGGSCPSILDLDALEVARQLTIKQMNIFCSIMPEELLGSQWMKNGGAESPNVKAMSTFSNDLSSLVSDTILHYNEVKKRAAVLKQWIKVAHQCLELNNYDALMAIICSLNSSTITRLRRTWEAVSPRRRELLKQLQAIVEPSQNNKVLRGRLHGHVPPCLPFLGMFLTDLTFVDIGNPAIKQLPGNEGDGKSPAITVINFDKHARTAKIIGELQRFQIPYRLQELTEVQEWIQAQIARLRELETPNDNVQVAYYRKSLLLEPREVTATPQTLRNSSETFSTSSATLAPPSARDSTAANGRAAEKAAPSQRTDYFGWMRGSGGSHRDHPAT